MLLHEAPASVLLARAPFDPAAFPSRVVVGLDGSEASLYALSVAARLCEDPASSLTVVIARLDVGIELDELERRPAPHPVRVDRHRPVEALVDAASRADLLVVGSRGVGGVRALGSVSERCRAPRRVIGAGGSSLICPEASEAPLVIGGRG